MFNGVNANLPEDLRFAAVTAEQADLSGMNQTQNYAVLSPLLSIDLFCIPAKR